MDDVLIGFDINSKGYGSISKLAMQDRNLHIMAKAIYAYFNSFTGGGNNNCFPTRKKICFDLGISNDTLGKYLKQLCQNGYIKIEQVKENGRFSHNIYTMCSTILPCPKISDTVNTDNGNLDTNINKANINNSYNKNSIYNISKEKDKEKKITDMQNQDFAPSPIEEKNKNSLKDKQNEVVDLYHSVCKSFSKVQTLTDKRTRNINKALKLYGIEKLKQAFEIAEQCKFLKGNNDRGWKADFDFLTNPENICKILEGKYNNNGGSAGKPFMPDYSGSLYD